MTHMYKRVAELVLKYHKREITEEEITELNNIRLNSGLDPYMFEELLDVHRLAADLQQMKMTAAKRLPKQRGVVHSLKKYSKIAAVAIPILVGLPWLLLFKNRNVNDLLHATNKATAIIDTKLFKPAADKSRISMNFENMDIQDLLRKLYRDPELEVIYPEGVQPLTFTGDIAPTTPYDKFAQILLAVNGYKSTIKGKKIIVHS
jgi:hypothetical protein